MTNIYRVREDNGEIYRPYKNRKGYYVLAIQKTRKPLHHKENCIFVKKESELVNKLLGRKFHLRMKGGKTGQVNLIAPHNIKIK